MKYIIYSTQERLFWSNEHGWVEFSLGSRFSPLEYSMLNTPMGGEWYVARATKKETLKNKVIFE